MQACPGCGAENPDGFRLCGYCGAPLATVAPERRRLVTAVFCDLSGSTALAERVDAEIVFGLVSSYFAEARAALERHGGTVEKFIGDAVVAMFGVPEAHEDDALRACRAALEIQERVSALNADLTGRYGTGIAVRIGVNSGEVVAGGTATRGTFASGDAVVLGDAVNIAARLEQAASPGDVLIGEQTHRLAGAAVQVEPVAPVPAKGKSEPLAAYRLLGVSGHGPVPRRSGSPLVGREDELVVLDREFELAVAERRCRLLTVTGEPGAGKSRLAAELLDRIGRRARSARGACLSYGDGITYWAVGQIVRELAGIRDEHSPERGRALLAELVAAVPDTASAVAQVAELLGIAEGTGGDPGPAIRRLLAAAAARGPVVVVVDDVQWAEPALLELLRRLPERIRDAPILVLCLARPELLEREPGWPVAISLGPLGDEDLARLLETLGAPEGERARLVRAAAGNPLFAEELAAWLTETEREALPTSLIALLGARLDRLAASARDAIERGAIEGELFHRGAVVELSDPGARAGVPAELEALADRDLVRPAAASLAGEPAFRFKHILVRDAAYGATAKRLRAELHERFADWLARFAGERAVEYEEILGYHLEQSYLYSSELGPPGAGTLALGERAAAHLEAAGRRATTRADYRAAVSLLERALAIGIAEPGRRAHVRFELSEVLGRMGGRGAERAALIGEVFEEATRQRDDALAARAGVRGLSVPLFNLDVDLAEARAVTEAAIETLTRLGDERGLAEACHLHGQAYTREGRTAMALADYERALTAAEASGNRSLRRAVIASIAMTMYRSPTPADEALRRCQELIRSSPDDSALEATVMRCNAAHVAMAGRGAEALELVARSGGILDELDIFGASIVWREAAADAHEYAGDRAGAMRELETKWRRLDELRSRPFDVQAMGAAYKLALLFCDEERWEEAEQCLDYESNAPPSRVWYEGRSLRLAGLARLAARSGRYDDAVALAEEAVADVDEGDVVNLRARIRTAVAQVQRAAGNDVAADQAIAGAIALYEQKGNVAAVALLRR